MNQSFLGQLMIRAIKARSAIKAHTCDIIHIKAEAFIAYLVLGSSGGYRNLPLKSNNYSTTSNGDAIIRIRGVTEK